MWNTLLDISAYWDWFMIRQGVKGAKNVIQRSFARGALESIIPAIGCVSILVIFFRTLGVNLPESSKDAIFLGAGALILILVLKGGVRCKMKMAEFEKYDKILIKKYDRYVWVFTLSCIALMVMMGIVVTHISATGKPIP